MRITVIDHHTGEVHAVEEPQKSAEKELLIIDSDAMPEKLAAESASEKPAAWRGVQFQDGTRIEINLESGEIVAQ